MGRKPRCSKDGLKKGAWTTLEDEMLMDYVKIHGEGKWSNIVKETGLQRCGKSCRLRWMNYLRPNIKRGNISDDEEDLIIRLHKLLGNRWSLIAGRLPGRTDNEIKNYWHTNIAKKAQHSQNRRQPRVDRKQVASGSQNGVASKLTNTDSAGVADPPSTAALQQNNIAQDHEVSTSLAMAPPKTYHDQNESSSKGLSSGGGGDDNSSNININVMDYNYMDDFSKFLDSEFPKLSDINDIINSTDHHCNNTVEIGGDQYYSMSTNNGCNTREIADQFHEKLSEANWSSSKCVQADQGFDFMSLLSFLDSADDEWTENALGANVS